MPELAQNETLDSASRAVDAGRYDEALGLLKTLAQAQPDNSRVFEMAGRCLLRLGDHAAALDAFQRAIRIEADWPAPYCGAAEALAARGDAHASMQALLHVLDIAPGHLQATQQLTDLLARLKPDGYLSALEPALLQCFSHPDLDPGPLGRLCGQQLRLSIVEQLPGGQGINRDLVRAVAGKELWIHYLSKVINTDAKLEEFLTNLRRYLCLLDDSESLSDQELSLLAALAQQCFLNEYVFEVSSEELDQLAVCERALHEGREEPDATARLFALGCLYRAPGKDDRALQLAAALSASCPWIEGLCRQTVVEPSEEARLELELPTLGAISDNTSLAVQAQYEANPYPRWQVPPAPPRSSVVADLRRRFSLRQPSPVATDAPRVLVAGCGTGYEPIDIARRDKTLQVTAIDLSRRSLAYAMRRASQLGCTNIEFYEGDILDLPATTWKFDLIFCTGVLHHMADPMAGWRALRDSLAADGMMRIGLYSAHARRVIGAARDVAKARVSEVGSDDIRGFRKGVLRSDSDTELEALLASDDFYSMSGCRDLVFHVQEHQFTLPEIESALAELKLRFCGFQQANAAVQEAFRSRFTDPGSLLDLKKWDEFENAHPHIFSAMYQFWCEPQ